MPFGGLLTVGLIGAGTSLFGGFMGSSASKKAANQQVDAENKALDFQKQMWGQQQENQAPYLQAGQTSIGNIMADLQSGKFGAGSLPAVPTAPGPFTGKFSAPTLEEARATPGYEFTREQGTRGILQGAAATGGAISGGTLKALDNYNTGLADTTYNDVFNRALQTYGAGIQGYQTNLQDYASQLAAYQTAQSAQAQGFQQEAFPAQLGEGAVVNLNNTGQQVSQNVGNIMGNIGNAQAAGTVGSANAWTSAVGNLGNIASQSLILNSVLPALQGNTAAATAPRASIGSLMNMGMVTPVASTSPILGGIGPN
jgi:hypothetical protein